MSRRKKTKDEIIEKITQVALEDVMHRSIIPYAEHVILDRALPRVEDGLKPVQRRILYTMYELAITPDKPHRKCARIVGDCLGKYHPHGDTSVYDALTRMAQDFLMRYPLVDGHGNFGSIDGDSPAAMRYTEARMCPLTQEMLRDIEKNTVPFVLNFEDELQEPDLLPSRFPNLLVNGSNGIAVGLATNIPPHNIVESIDATIAMLKKPEITIDELMKYIKGPDFPTAGIILESDEIKKAYSTGKGKIVNRARAHFEPSQGGRTQIVVTEIPYQVNKSEMLEGIQKLTESGAALSGKIYSIRDESDRNGMRAVIETKKDVDPNQVLSILYKKSKMEKNFNVNIVAIADGKPQQLNLKEIIFYYIKHQKSVLIKRSEYELEKAKARLNILDGLLIALENIDEVIKVIRDSKNPKMANAKLCERFELNTFQAQAILEMRLQRLTNLEVIAIEKEHSQLLKDISYLNSILSSETQLTKLLIKELDEIKNKSGDSRRTSIENDKLADIVIEEEKEPVIEYIVDYTSDEKLQKYLIKDYSNEIKMSDINDSNIIKDSISLNSDEKLLIFTNLANCYNIDASMLPTINKKNDRGLMLNAIIDNFEHGEKIISIINPARYNNSSNVITITSLGIIKVSPLPDYIINRSKFIAMNLGKNDMLLNAFVCDSGLEVLITSKHGNVLRFNTDEIKSISRTSKGVSAIKLDNGDNLISGEPILSKENNLLLITEKGYAKQIPLIDISPKGRNTKGSKLFSFYKNESNGSVVVFSRIVNNESFLFIKQSKSNPCIISNNDIPIQNKNGKGLPIIVSVLDDNITEVEGIFKNEIIE